MLESLENISDGKRTQLSDLALEIFTRSVIYNLWEIRYIPHLVGQILCSQREFAVILNWPF